MKLNKATLAVTLAFLSLNVVAENKEYQHEASVGYLAYSEDVGDGILGANYRYYFSPVNQDSSPYALNGFLSQTSNVGTNYSYFNELNMDSSGVDGTYVFDSKLFVSLDYQYTSIGNVDFNTYGVEVGYYVDRSISVSAFFDYDDHAYGNDKDSYGLQIRRYLELSSSPGIDLSARWEHVNSNNRYTLGADWYVSDSWSVGTGYDRVGSDGDFDIRTAYWLRMSDSFSANFAISKIVDPDVDGFNLGFAVTGRF
ncbi:putative porin [Shewanella atlantica]|uniref:Putative porin n=2 Tax=Shewanella atlantica TaxID=271099 RepID=A0A431VSB2_9GAMM|nr:putative porin [Shewanella atlantica]